MGDFLRAGDPPRSIFPVSAWLRSREIKQKTSHNHLWCACREDAVGELGNEDPELLRYREELAAQLAPTKEAFLEQVDQVQEDLEDEHRKVGQKLRDLSHHLSELQAALGAPKKRRRAMAQLTTNAQCFP